MGPSEMGEAYRAWDGDNRSDYNQGGHHEGRRPFTYMDRLQQAQSVEEAEDLDVNAAIHAASNWTIENAKSKLHQFMQLNKLLQRQTTLTRPINKPDHTRFQSLGALSVTCETPHFHIFTQFYVALMKNCVFSFFLTVKLVGNFEFIRQMEIVR